MWTLHSSCGPDLSLRSSDKLSRRPDSILIGLCLSQKEKSKHKNMSKRKFVKKKICQIRKTVKRNIVSMRYCVRKKCQEKLCRKNFVSKENLCQNVVIAVFWTLSQLVVASFVFPSVPCPLAVALVFHAGNIWTHSFLLRKSECFKHVLW